VVNTKGRNADIIQTVLKILDFSNTSLNLRLEPLLLPNAQPRVRCLTDNSPPARFHPFFSNEHCHLLAIVLSIHFTANRS